MSEKSLMQLCRISFKFLSDEFGFDPVESRSGSSSEEYALKNRTTGVRITADFREFYVFVAVCRLQDGDFPDSPGEICPDTVLHCYDLDDLVALRAPHNQLPPLGSGTQFGEALINGMILRQAENLRVCAADVLTGDFTVFDELDRVVKARAKEAALQKWGDRAHEFGWQ